MSASKLARGVDLSICIWLEFMDEADQEPPDPASSVAWVFVAAGIKDQCSPDLAAGILECELVELLVEVCYGLGTESAQERARTDEPYGWVSMMYKVPTNGGGQLTVPLPLLLAIGPAVDTIASAPLVIAGRMVSR